MHQAVVNSWIHLRYYSQKSHTIRRKYYYAIVTLRISVSVEFIALDDANKGM